MLLESNNINQLDESEEVTLNLSELLSPVVSPPHEEADETFSLRDKINENPNKTVIELTESEVKALAERYTSSQMRLTNLWDNAPNFAQAMGYEGSKKDIFNSIVLDALKALKVKTEVRYSRNKSGYNGCGHLGYVAVTKAVKFLSDNHYILDFRVPKNSGGGLQSFFLPLEALMSEFGFMLEDREAKLKPLSYSIDITVRGEMDCPVYGTFKPKTRMKAKGEEFTPFNEELKLQNEFLSGFDIDFRPLERALISRDNTIIHYVSSKKKGNKQKDERVINIANVAQKRVFLRKKKDDEISYGGRFYGGFWQRLSEGDRSRIKINDEWVGKEQDYKSLHPTLAYCLANAEMPENVYHGDCDISDDFGERWREVCKVTLLISINAKTLNAAKGALSIELVKKFPEKYPKITDDENDRKRRLPARRHAKTIIKAVIKHNDGIKDFILSDYGIKFQRIDSYMMEQVQRQCREKGIPILGVHDSILFPRSKHKITKQIFKMVLEDCKIRLKEDGLSSYGM